MVPALTIKLFVVLYLVNGRYAYDAREYPHESDSNSDSNKTPGKREMFHFSSFYFGFKSIFPRKLNEIAWNWCPIK